jgi:hypothetical protein
MPSVVTLNGGDVIDLGSLQGTSTLIPPPFARLLRVEIEPPLPFGGVTDAIVTLKYADPTGTGLQSHRVMFLAEDEADWKVEQRAFALFGKRPVTWRDPVVGPITVEIVAKTDAGRIRVKPRRLTTNRVTFDDVAA